MVVTDLSDQIPGLTVDIPGDAKETGRRSDKDNNGHNLKNEYSRYFHEHGKGRIVAVREQGREEEE